MSYTTRSKIKERGGTTTQNDPVNIEAADSGVATFVRPLRSPSTANRGIPSDSNIPEIPLVGAGGRLVDLSTRELEHEATPTASTIRAHRKAPSVTSSRSSRVQREAARKRIEYEAELELCTAQQRLAEKKKAMQLAELEAEEEEDEEEAVERPEPPKEDRINEWIQRSSFEPVPEKTPYHGRESSRGRRQPGKAIEELAEALKDMAKPRPMPRAFYELPNFSGDPADWLFFKKKYEVSTAQYEYRPSENLLRLQSAIHGKAKQLVEDLLRTSSDPSEIMRCLERTYGSPNLLLKSAINKIRALPRTTDNDSDGLRTFSATVRSCISTLKNIKADGFINNPQLVSELLEKLTPTQRHEYSKFARSQAIAGGVDLRVSPTLTVFVDFLEELADTAAFVLPTDISGGGAATAPRQATMRKQTVSNRSNAKSVHKVNVHNSEIKCVLCGKDHRLASCKDFSDKSVNERWDFVKDNKLCFKCLSGNHSRLKCKYRRCAKCNYGHHTLLHVDKTGSQASESATQTERVTNLGDRRRVKSLLKVVPVQVRNGGRLIDTYALLDDGATISLIDEKLATELRGPQSPIQILSAGGHSIEDDSSRIVNVTIWGPNEEPHILKMRTIKKMNLPPQTVPKSVIENSEHLKGLGIEEMRDAVPLVLIGQDNWEIIVGGDIKRGKSGRPVASLTKLGWVIHGPVSIKSDEPDTVNCMAELNDLVRQQFDIDNMGIVARKRVNYEDQRALTTLNETAQLTDEGWEVGLLWRRDNVQMPDNYRDAEKRLRGIERKMNRNPEFATAYCAQVDRLVEKGYARRVEEPIPSEHTWFLPHFGVTNVNKPGKLRLVFDAAATYGGTSLNDQLLSGPDLLNSLLGILFKFRQKPIAITADIEDMFLRVKIRKKDQGAQLFLWKGKDERGAPEIYVMESMIFGATSSPTSAIFVLNKNADRFQEEFPEAVEAIKKRHYMDDYIDSVDSVEEAVKMIREVSDIHAQGNFNIRGWTTNHPELRSKLPYVTPQSVNLTKLGGETERTLGLVWQTSEDTLSFDVSFKKIKKEVASGEEVPTKREFLKLIMSLFDPLGLICPVTISSRILMQRIWKTGVKWDETINEEDDQEWKEWIQSLHMLKTLKIPRYYGLEGEEVELHVFSDASEQAYATVAYLVDKKKNVALVAGKAKVTPMKIVSMPRLELQAAVLACRLADMVGKEHSFLIPRRVFWTDSKTVLHWIRSDPRDYKPFVAHRLAEIDEKSRSEEWRWVPTAQNPADEATRKGWTPEKSIWFSGPDFLKSEEAEWPIEDKANNTDEMTSELRPNRVHAIGEAPPPLLEVQRFSTWIRAVRTMARVLAFIKRLKKKERPEITGSLIREAENVLIRQSQKSTFETEIRNIMAGEDLPKQSRLKALDPMITEDGLLRVRGRIQSADVPFEERHPIILDAKDRLTELIIWHYHKLAHHANNEAVVNMLREKYWIMKMRPAVKKIARNCPMCTIRKALPNPPKMGDLPSARLAHHRRAFTHCGIDYFGPMEVTIGRRREKRWGIVLTCLTSRAVHLEVASSLSADSAIMALRRFIARRGQPEVIYSDQGTNFVKANKEMWNAWKNLEIHHLEEAATTLGIRWKFISPASPHMGGCWERLVRSTKTALKATLNARAPREEVLLTLLAEAEAMINSRPLTHVSVDPNDPVTLTPNHLLLGTASTTTRLGNFTEEDLTTKKQWRAAQALADMFWRRWTSEYLPTLQKRSKWTKEVAPLKVGDLVLIVDPTLPRNVWPRGEVVKVYPGADGQVRVVDIRTCRGTLRRPAVKVVVLPTEA